MPFHLLHSQTPNSDPKGPALAWVPSEGADGSEVTQTHSMRSLTILYLFTGADVYFLTHTQTHEYK